MQMVIELELTKANRLKLAQAFRHHPRVDISIECVVEGQMGTAFVDVPQNPTVYRIVQGPFWHLAGEAKSAAGHEMIHDLPAYTLLMPSPGDWVQVAQDIYRTRLLEFNRHSFAADGLSQEHLGNLLSLSRFRDAIKPIDVALASQVWDDAKSFMDLSAFYSAEDFVMRGVGFCLQMKERVVAAAYSSLVCSQSRVIQAGREIGVPAEWNIHGILPGRVNRTSIWLAAMPSGWAPSISSWACASGLCRRACCRKRGEKPIKPT